MSVNLSETESIVEELHQNCTGGWIQKIHQPFPHTITLDIRVPGETLVLLICSEPRFARLHLASKKNDNPPTPPPFCQFLRAHLEGGRIEAITQEPGDRVVYFTIATGTEQFFLVVALTGNQSNVYLLNETKKVIQSLKPSWLKIGDAYSPPNRSRVPSTPSPRPSPIPSPQKGEENRVKKTAADFLARLPVSAEIEERYLKEEQDHNLSQIRNTQLSMIKKALKQAKKKMKGLHEDLQKAEKYKEYARYGELLKGQLPCLTKGQTSVTVVDYYDPALPQLTLPLDSSKDPVWNMEDYFKKHHKFLSAEKHLRPRLESAKQEALRLQEELTKLESGDEPPQEETLLFQKKRKRGSMAAEQKTKPPQARATGYRKFVSIDGLPLLVGKTAKDNDTLTFKVAGSDDLWLHARGIPGSHVVVRLEKGSVAPHETLRDAATLALWFSDLRKSGKGEVIYTYRKFVKKAKGQKVGTVTVSREKSIWIEIKDERLERLKGSGH